LMLDVWGMAVALFAICFFQRATLTNGCLGGLRGTGAWDSARKMGGCWNFVIPILCN
jgi:hypothetical protein